MARRETIRRQDCDGTTRPHEIELNYFRCRAADGREVVFESDSGFAARARARIIFGVEQVEVEIIYKDAKDIVLFTDGQGNPMVTQPATTQELSRSQAILEAHPSTPLPSTVTTLPAPPPSKPEELGAIGEVLEMMTDGASQNALVAGPLADGCALARPVCGSQATPAARQGPMTWDEILEEKNVRIKELEKQLSEAHDEIEWTLEVLSKPLRLEGNKLPAVREIRKRLGEFLEKFA
jgi:hypothetical protein